MSDERETGDEVEEIVEGITSGIETGGQIAEGVERIANGEDGAPATPGGVLRGIGTGLDVGGDVLEELGADPRLVAMVEGIADAAPVLAAAVETAEALVDAGRSVVKALRGDQRRVEYDIELAVDEGWKVSEIDLSEKLGAPYVARIRIRTDERDARPLALLGTNATLIIRRGEHDVRRPIHGLIAKVERGDETPRHVEALIEIVPALQLLSYIVDSRVFQDLSIVGVIDVAIRAYLSEYDRDIRLEVSDEKTHPRREYCVQYQETALDFFHRLLEDGGLTYYFDQSGEREVVVVVDDNGAFPRAALMPEARGVPYVPSVTGNTVVREEPLRELIAVERLGPTSLTIADFDWTAETLPFSAEQRSTDAQEKSREQYLHTRATVIGDYKKDARKYQTFDHKHRVDRGRELQAMGSHELRGRSEVVGLGAGSVLQVVDHPHDLDGEYLVVSVQVSGHDHHLGDDASVAVRDRPEYENTFVCIPLEVQYRPPQVTPLPRIHGVQTALVVGPTDEEIWVDEHGRVRIQLHWDRQGRRDETSTCWVRVMQSWAGAGFGTLFIPRIGTEVVVSFLDGNPDRPLITGCVYNGNHFPPIDLPADKTRSTIKTRSSPGDDRGYNELRFEDKAGEEQIYVHAQKDLVEKVLNDRKRSVGANEDVTIEGDQTVEITGAQSVTVTGERRIQVEDEDHLTVNKTRTVRVSDRDTETYRGGRQINVRGQDELEVEGTISVIASERIRLEVGKASIEISADGVDLQVGGSGIHIDASQIAAAAQTIALAVPQAFVRLESGGKLDASGSNRAELSSGDSAVTVKPQGIQVQSATIRATAEQEHAIVGSPVNIN